LFRMTVTGVRFHDHVLYRSVPGGGGVVLDLERRGYLALDEVAARMWEVLSDTGAVSAVVDSLALEFDVDRAVLAEDVQQFVRTLASRSLVQLPDA
jgi:hypothetical protein